MIPERIVGRGGDDAKGFFFDRMNEINLTGMEMDGSVFVGTVKSVLEIALYGTSHGGKLNPDLVVPSGMRGHFDEVVIV